MEVNMEIDQGSKSMVNYNNASDMQLKVMENGFDNLLIVDNNLVINSNKLVIADLACSHGKNSMHVLKQFFDLLWKNKKLANKINEVVVHHEDLPDNDFKQVQKCLEDEELSYLYHPLIKTANIHIVSNMINKSYDEPLFDPSSINLAMCYTAIHWMPRYKSLANGVTFQREKENEENVQWFQNLAKDSFLYWLDLRYEELAPNGLLSMNIFTECSHSHTLNDAWDGYLTKLNISQKDLNKVIVPLYYRPQSEINECLSIMSNRFKIHRNEYFSETYHFSRKDLKAITFYQLFQGLSHYSERFPTIESKNQFIEDYYDYYFNHIDNPQYINASFVYLVLEKI